MTKQKQNNLPTVVGELVAEMRSSVRNSACSSGVPFFVPDITINKWADRLSALTAEAGKGELPELPEHEGTMTWTRSAGLCINPEQGYTADQMHEYARLALSTATPAGEWREIDPFLDEAINGAVSDLDMIAAGVDPDTGDKLTHAAVQAIARASAITLNEAWTLAASPRGAGES